MKKKSIFMISLIAGAILMSNQVKVEAISINDGSFSAGGSTGNSTASQKVKQEISLGGDAVGSDAAHKSGFARVRLDMFNGKLSLVKNSDYNFHKFYDNELYAEIKVKDAKGKVLYYKSWNGNESITDLAKGKLGEFASWNLSDGSTVEIYHAEGKNHRFHTSNDAELKAKKPGTAYKYVVEKGQLKFVESTNENLVKQEISLGGDAVGSDAAHKSGFARVRLDMFNGKLSLVKNSDYNFHKFYDNELYAGIKVKDAKGKVLYYKSWNGNESITDLAKGKLGEFASWNLSDGSTVEIYHAEGKNHRFHTSNDAELKAKKPGTAYKYVVEKGQLKFVENTNGDRSLSGAEGKDLSYTVTKKEVHNYYGDFNILELIETNDAYVFTIERGFLEKEPEGMARDIILRSENGDIFKADSYEDVFWGHKYAITFKKNKELVGKATFSFWEALTISMGKYATADLQATFDTGVPYHKSEAETPDSVVLYGDYNAKKPRIVHNDAINVPLIPIVEFRKDISSVKLPPRTSIILYSYVNYGGFQVTFDNKTDKTQVYNMPSEYNDMVVGYKISDNSIRLFNDYNAGGKVTKQRSKYLSVPSMGADNDKLSSVNLPAHTTIILYESVNYQGPSEVITNSSNEPKTYNVSKAMNDKTSSYEYFEEIKKGVYDKKLTTIQNIQNVWDVLDWDQGDKDKIITYKNNGGNNQKWNFFYDASDDTYRIKSSLVVNGREIFVTAGISVINNSDRSINITTKGAMNHRPYADKWRLIKVGSHTNGDVFAFRNVETGRVLDMPEGKVGLPVILYSRKHDNGAQHFVIHVEGNFMERSS